MAFQGEEIYYTGQQLLPDNQQANVTNEDIKKRFIHFLREWEHNKLYVYREMLIKNHQLGKNFIEVDIEDLYNHDQQLTEGLRNKPTQFHPMLEQAALEVLSTLQIKP